MARVLLVADDPGIRQVERFALGDEGNQVEEACAGQSAQEQVDRVHPNVILLGMKMPSVDRWDSPAATARATTAAHDAARRAGDVGADGYVAKPFGPDVLFDRVAEAARGAARPGARVPVSTRRPRIIEMAPAGDPRRGRPRTPLASWRLASRPSRRR